jgi:hypothetical protein
MMSAVISSIQNSEAIIAVVDSSYDPQDALAMFQVWTSPVHTCVGRCGRGFILGARTHAHPHPHIAALLVPPSPPPHTRSRATTGLAPRWRCCSTRVTC